MDTFPPLPLSRKGFVLNCEVQEIVPQRGSFGVLFWTLGHSGLSVFVGQALGSYPLMFLVWMPQSVKRDASRESCGMCLCLA